MLPTLLNALEMGNVRYTGIVIEVEPTYMPFMYSIITRNNNQQAIRYILIFDDNEEDRLVGRVYFYSSSGSESPLQASLLSRLSIVQHSKKQTPR